MLFGNGYPPEVLRAAYERLLQDMLSNEPSRRSGMFDAGIANVNLGVGPVSAEFTSSIIEIANFSDMPPGPVNVNLASGVQEAFPTGPFKVPFFIQFRETGANSFFSSRLVQPIRIMEGASLFNTVVNAPFMMYIGQMDAAPAQMLTLAWKIHPSLNVVQSAFFSHVSRRVLSIPSSSSLPSATDFIFPSGSELDSSLQNPEACGFGWKPNKVFIIKKDITNSIVVEVALPFGNPPAVDIYPIPAGQKFLELDIDPSWGGAIRLTNLLVDPTDNIIIRWERTKDL